ncbi:hypothetical protein [Streptomyces sp. WG-D5]
MTVLTATPPPVLGVTPFAEPDARLAAAVSRAGALGVLDLGRGGRAAREALGRLRSWCPAAFGVRVPAGCALHPDDLQDPEGTGPHTVLLGPVAPWRVGDVQVPCVFAEVTDVRQARDAVAEGAAGLVVRDGEPGDGEGELPTFALLRAVLDEVEGAGDAVPVWAGGGAGPRAAATAALAGAVGVVLDDRLPLLAERYGTVARAVGAVRDAITASGRPPLRTPSTNSPHSARS